MTRFPTYPPDILSRADALLSARYGTDKPIDPLLVEIACEAMMAERERLTDPAFLARQIEAVGMVGKEAITAEQDRMIALLPRFVVDRITAEDIAKAIRGTE